MKTDKISIIKPFDAHVHLRDGQLLKTVIPYTINSFGAAVAMGNLADPVDDLKKVLRYQEEIKQQIPANNGFMPIMSMMVTKNSTPLKISEAEGIVKVLKFIPGATSTNSDTGVSLFDFQRKYYPVLEAAEKANMIFSIHAELINDTSGCLIPELKREEEAIPFVKDIILNFPRLKIVFEHVSTAAACELVKESSANVAATITLHHLLLDYDLVYNNDGNVKNIFYYCKPIAKKRVNSEAIRTAAFSGNKKFFFGSDSAPHLITAKMEKGAAGIFTAPVALEKLAEIFFSRDQINLLEKFVSVSGREFYGLPIPEEKVTLIYQEHEYPEEIGGVKIFNLGGNKLQWEIE